MSTSALLPAPGVRRGAGGVNEGTSLGDDGVLTPRVLGRLLSRPLSRSSSCRLLSRRFSLLLLSSTASVDDDDGVATAAAAAVAAAVAASSSGVSSSVSPLLGGFDDAVS